MKNILLTTTMILATIHCCTGQDITQTTTSQVNRIPSKGLLLKDSTSNALFNQTRDEIGSPSKPIRQVPWFVEKFKISAGFFLSLNNTGISVGDKTGTGSKIDFQNDLGFNRSTGTFLTDFQWRSSSRSRFDLSYYGIYQSTDHVLQKDIEFGDHTYNLNTNVNAFFNTNILRLSYGYAILSKPNYEAGLLIGAHIVKASVGISLVGNNANSAAQDSFGVTAPMPDFGVWGGYTLSKHWAINGEFDFLSLTVDGTTGKILGYNFAVTYRPIKQLDIVLGYTGLNFNVTAVRNYLTGDLKWGNNGPSLAVAFSFGRKSWQ